MKPCYQVMRGGLYDSEDPVGFTYTREWYADYIAYRSARQDAQKAQTYVLVASLIVIVADVGVYYRVRAIHPTFPD